MPMKKKHWWLRSRRHDADLESPLAKAAIQVLDKQHATFKAILATMNGVMTPSSFIRTNTSEREKNMKRQEWMQKVPRLQFWQNEPSLVPVVKKLLDEQTLTDAELAAVKEYVQSWITWLALIPDEVEYVALMEEIAAASQRHLMSKTIDRLLEYDIDPF